MTSGRLVAWHVKPGDEVQRGDIVATVDTSKAEIDIEIFQDGDDRARCSSHAGERVPVGAVLATVKPRGAPARRGGRARGAALTAEPPAAPARAAPRAAAPLASPLARRAAAGRGIARGRRRQRPGRRDAGRRPGRAREPAAEPPAEPAPDRAADDAPGDRRGDGALQARDPALLPGHDDRRRPPLLDWLADHNAALPVRRARAARRA